MTGLCDLVESERSAHVRAIRSAVTVPLIVDADTGLGEGRHVRRTVQEPDGLAGRAVRVA